MTKPITEFSVSHYRDGKIIRRGDHVIHEVSLDISYNGNLLAEIACTGIHLKELSLGFLLTEGLISDINDVKKIHISESPPAASVSTNKKDLHPAPTKSIMSSGARRHERIDMATPLTGSQRIASTDVISLMTDLLASSALHEVTGGTHCSGLAREGKLVALREDIGRHNTIDMCIGYSLIEGIESSNTAILTTGRISSEIVGKVWRFGAPFIISHSAPTSKAIDLAGNAGITLIGYVRGTRMRVYTHERRVIF